MSKIIYRIGIFFYSASIWVASLFNTKAQLFIEGRKNQWEGLSAFRKKCPNDKVLWMHCASLGEFEQGRPIIETVKKQHPDIKVALTFFSPSGYEVRKDYSYADWVGYLPLDTAQNAEKFLDYLRPTLGIIVKYEIWVQHLTVAYRRQIPVYLIGAVFRPGQLFFSIFGGLFRNALRHFEHIFVQDKASSELLSSIKISNVTIAGDPRIDSVIARKNTYPTLAKVKEFLSGKPTFIIGSSWMKDMVILQRPLEQLIGLGWKIIIAPHDISKRNIEAHAHLFPDKTVKYSALSASNPDVPILIIDNIGMLSALYQYGKIAYIGGGFGEGIHSTLEPAAFHLPLIFGPKYQKFIEAVYFVQHKGAFSVQSEADVSNAIQYMLDDENHRQMSEVIREFMEQNQGSTALVVSELELE